MSGQCCINSDIIMNGIVSLAPCTLAALASCYIETGKTLLISGSGQASIAGQANYGAVVWGPGGLDVQGTCRLRYPIGSGKAAATFQQTGGFTLNGATGCLLSTRGAALVVGKTLSAAALDADLGATLGAYLNPGGASITNEAS